jgi:hypothetical protein
MKRGDFVELSSGGEQVRGLIVLASENELSLAVMFDGIFRGYVGMIPLLRTEYDPRGFYRDLMRGAEVMVRIQGEQR